MRLHDVIVLCNEVSIIAMGEFFTYKMGMIDELNGCLYMLLPLSVEGVYTNKCERM